MYLGRVVSHRKSVRFCLGQSSMGQFGGVELGWVGGCAFAFRNYLCKTIRKVNTEKISPKTRGPQKPPTTDSS